MSALSDSVMAANATSSYVPGAVAWNIGERLNAQDPRQVANIQAGAQTYAADLAAKQQREAAALQAETTRRNAELQYNASIFPEQQRMQRFNTLLGGLFGGGGATSFGNPGGGYTGPGAQLAMYPGGLRPPAAGGGGGGGGGFSGMFGGFGFGGGQPFDFDVDRTLPQFNENPFSQSNQLHAIQGMKASSDRQLGTEQRTIAENAAARGFGASSPQVQAMQSQARQANSANQMSQERGVTEQYGMGRAQQEQQQQSLLAQRRSDIDKARAAAYAGQAGQKASLFNSLLGAI